MATRRDYWVGVGLTGLGAVILSPDAMLFRLLEGPLWTSAFWRLLLMGLAVWAFLIAMRGTRLIGDMRGLGWALPVAAICIGVSNLGFVFALSRTSIADTLAILATAPIFAAIFATLLGERPPPRTWLAAIAIAAGIAIIFDASFGADAWAGNLAAMTVAISIAIYFVIGRAKASSDLSPALALGAIFSSAAAGTMAVTVGQPLLPPSADWALLLFSGLVVLPISLTLITLGPRRLPAAEVGLLMLLETALGPVWGWLALGETPSQATLLGGGLIVGSLILHGLDAWRVQQRGR